MDSLHPIGCPEWEYKRHPTYRPSELRARAVGIIRDLRNARTDSCGAAADTRPIHKQMFDGLTPIGHDYFAGHYRGEGYRCLQYYAVEIRGDRSVGLNPTLVFGRMSQFSREIRGGIAALDLAQRLPNSVVPSEQKLLRIIEFSCSVFEIFLRIHPFANGNGHMGRFMIWAILGRYGYWPSRWPIEPRPPDPPYTTLITQCRAGIHGPLEDYILRCLAT